MFSTRRLAIIAVGATALFGANAALAATLVVRSTGPSATTYPAGKKLLSEGKVTLKAGDVVTVMDAGGTRVLKGPGVVAVSGSKVASGSGFATLIANTGARQARTGATRGVIGGGPARSPNLWFVDAGRSGAHCVADVSAMALWRPDSSVAETISVTSVRNGRSVDVDFRAGQSVRAWPEAELPVSDGAGFTIDGTGAKASVTVTTAMITPASTELDGIAAALLPKGCSNQLDVLVEGTIGEDHQLASAPH